MVLIDTVIIIWQNDIYLCLLIKIHSWLKNINATFVSPSLAFLLLNQKLKHISFTGHTTEQKTFIV